MASNAQEIMTIMLETLEVMNNTDDAPTLNIKMKLVNNIDFVIDNIMNEYVERKD